MASTYILADLFSLYNASIYNRDTCHLGTQCIGSNNLAVIDPSFCDIGCVAFITIMSIIGLVLLILFGICLWRSRRRYEIAANIGFASSDEEDNIRQTGDIRKGDATTAATAATATAAATNNDKKTSDADKKDDTDKDKKGDTNNDDDDDAENQKPNCCQSCIIWCCSPPDEEEEERKQAEKEAEMMRADPIGTFIEKIKVEDDVAHSQIHVASRSILQHCKAFQFSTRTFIQCLQAAHKTATDANLDKEFEQLFVLSEMAKKIIENSLARNEQDKIKLCFAYRFSNLSSECEFYKDEEIKYELRLFQKRLFASIKAYETLWSDINVAEEARKLEDVENIDAESKMSEPMGCLFAFAIALREYDSQDRLSRACQLGFTPSQAVRLEKEIKLFGTTASTSKDDGCTAGNADNNNNNNNKNVQTLPAELTRSEFVQAYQAAFEDTSVYPNNGVLNRLFVFSTDKIPTRRLLNSVSQDADSQSRSFVKYFTSSILTRTKYANQLSLYIPYLIMFSVFLLFGLGYEEAFEMHDSIAQPFRTDRQPNVDVTKFPRSCSPNCKFYDSYFMAFDEIAFIADLNDWISGVFLPAVWPFSNQPASSFRFNGVVPVGALKIRQVRSAPYQDLDQENDYFTSKNPSENETKLINEWFATNGSNYPSLGLIHPPFGEGPWKDDMAPRNDIYNDPSLDDSIKLAFRYRTAAELNGSDVFFGKNIFFNADGFALVVPLSLQGSDASSRITTLFNKNWVDMSTRAIAFEMFFYNNQLHILHRTRMIFETTVGGLYVPYIEGTAVKLFNPGSHSFGFFIFLGVFLLYLFLYIVPLGLFHFFWSVPMEAMKRRREEGFVDYINSLKSDSMKSSWAIMLLLNSIVQGVTWIIRIVQLTFTTDSLGADIFQADFVPESFSTLASTATASYYTSALAIGFAYFIPLYFLTYQNDGLAVVKRTVSRAVGPLLSLVVISVMMLTAFAVCAFIAYGSVLPDYRDPGYSLAQVLLAVIGEYDYDEWRKVHLTFSSVFFFFLTVLLEILLLNMVVSILIDAFDVEMDHLFDAEGAKLLIQNDPFVQVPFPSRRDNFKASPFYNGFLTRFERILVYFKHFIHKIEECLKIDPKNCFIHPEFSLHHAIEAIESHDHYIYWKAMNDAVESIQFGSFDESFAGQLHICTQLMPMVEGNFDDLAAVLLHENEETNVDEKKMKDAADAEAGGHFHTCQTGKFERRKSSAFHRDKSRVLLSEDSDSDDTADNKSTNNNNNNKPDDNDQGVVKAAYAASSGSSSNKASSSKSSVSSDASSSSSSSSDDNSDDLYGEIESDHKTLKGLIAENFGQVRTTLLLFQAMPNYHLAIPSSVLLLTALETRHRWGQEIAKFTVRTDQDEALDPRSACLTLETLSKDIEDAQDMKKNIREAIDPITNKKTYTAIKKILPRRQTKQVLLPSVTEKEKTRLLEAIEPRMDSNSVVDGISTEDFTKIWNDLRIGMAKTKAQQTFYRGKIIEDNTDSGDDDDSDDDKNAKNDQQQQKQNQKKQDGGSTSAVKDDKPVIVATGGSDSDDSSSSSSSSSDDDHNSSPNSPNTVLNNNVNPNSDSEVNNMTFTAPATGALDTTTNDPNASTINNANNTNTTAPGQTQTENKSDKTSTKRTAETVSAAASATTDVKTDLNEVIATTSFLFPTREEYRAQPEDFYDISEIVNGEEYIGRSTIQHFLNECMVNWGERRKQSLAIRWSCHRVAAFMEAVRRKTPQFNFDQLIIQEPEPGYTLDGKTKLPPVGLGRSKFIGEKYKKRIQEEKEQKRKNRAINNAKKNNNNNTSNNIVASASTAEARRNRGLSMKDTSKQPTHNNNNNNNNNNNDNDDQELQPIQSFVIVEDVDDAARHMTIANSVDHTITSFASSPQKQTTINDTDDGNNKKKKKNREHALTIPREFIVGWKAAQGTSKIPPLVQRALVGTTYEEFFAAATKNSRQSLTFFDLVSVYLARDSTLFFNTLAYTCFVVLFTIFACSNRAIDELVWFTEGTKESYATQQFTFQSLDNGISSTTTGPNIVDSQFINCNDVQNWIQFVEQIVFDGAFQNPTTSTGRYVSQTNQETPIGSIVIRQIRSQKVSCVGALDPLRPVVEPDLSIRTDLAGRAAALSPSCVDHSQKETDPFGNSTTLAGLDPLLQDAFRYRSCDDLGLAGTYVTDYENIDCDGYAFILPLSKTKTEATNLFQSLINSGWIDDQTSVLAINMITFNYNLNFFARWRFFLQITRGGEVFPRYDVNLVRPWIPEQASTVYIIFLAVFYLSIILQAISTLSTMKDDYVRERGIGSTKWMALVRACTDDTWWILNLSNVIILLLLWSWRFAVMVISTDDIFIFKSDVAKRIEELAELQVMFDIIEALCAILTYFRVAYYLRSFPSLNLLARTLFIAGTEIWSLVIIFVVVFLGFSISAFMIIGPVIFEFATVELALGTLFRGLLGADVNFDQMIEFHPVWTGLFYTAFIIVCEFVLFNLIIAVLNDSLEKARNETTDTESFEIAIIEDSRSGNALRYKKYEFLGPLAYIVGVITTEAKFKLQKVRNFFAKPCVSEETWEMYEIQQKHHPETFWKTLLVCASLPNPLRAYSRWTYQMRKSVGAAQLPEVKPYPESSSSNDGGGADVLSEDFDDLVMSPTIAIFNSEAAKAQNVLVPSNFTKIISDFDIKESYDDQSSYIDQGNPFSLLENVNSQAPNSLYLLASEHQEAVKQLQQRRRSSVADANQLAQNGATTSANNNNNNNNNSTQKKSESDSDDHDFSEDELNEIKEDLLRVRRVEEALNDKLGELSSRALNLAIFAHVVTNLPTNILLKQMMQRRHEYLMEREDFDGRNLNQVVRLSRKIICQLHNFEHTPNAPSDGTDPSNNNNTASQMQQLHHNLSYGDQYYFDSDNDQDEQQQVNSAFYAISPSRINQGKAGNRGAIAQKIQQAADGYWSGKFEQHPERDFKAVPVACPPKNQQEHAKHLEETQHRINLGDTIKGLFTKNDDDDDDDDDNSGSNNNTSSNEPTANTDSNTAAMPANNEPTSEAPLAMSQTVKPNSDQEETKDDAEKK